jgi:pyrophosphatase PpaX
MSRPLALLFDLDGTLLDSISLLLACMKHAFSDFPARKPTDAEWIAGIGTPLGQQLDDYARSAEERDALTLRYRTFQRTHHDEYTSCFDGTLETIRSLREKGHPMGIVTSKSNELMQRGLDFVGLTPFMDVLVGLDSTHIHKPHPYPVHFALEKLGYEPQEAAFIGDSPHDMEAGRAAGVITIAALWGPFTREMLQPTAPDYFIERITELPNLIERISGATQG